MLRVLAESVGCAVSAGTAGLAIVLLLNSSPPTAEWVGGWTPVDGYGYLNAELAVDH